MTYRLDGQRTRRVCSCYHEGDSPDVGEEEEALVGQARVVHLEQVDVGDGHTGVARLQALVVAHQGAAQTAWRAQRDRATV